MIRLKLLLWAMLGRPIIYGCKLKGGIELTEDNRNVYVARNSFGQAKIMTDKPWRPKDRAWMAKRSIFFGQNQPTRPHYKTRQRDYEAGADEMMAGLFKLAEESPTKTFTIDSGTINVFKEG